MKLKLRTTEVFKWNRKAYEDDKIRYIINQGSSRSSKTYSIIQLIIWQCLINKVKVDIVRRTLKSMKGSVINDFKEIMTQLELFNDKSFNRTDFIYTFENGSSVNFIGADDDNKLRGSKRDILYINEGNDVSRDVFTQLDIRTENNGKVFIDFNPSDYDNWIYKLIEQDRAILIKSTYKSNPFLSKEQIQTIENLILTDENYYRIYALGERPISDVRIYNHFQEGEYEDFVDQIQDKVYGLDFGYNHATALVECNNLLEGYFLRQKIYSKGLTIPDLIDEMDRLEIDKGVKIYADAARPDAIEEINRAGYWIEKADKDVKGGIDKVRSSIIIVDKNSTDIWNEYRKYSWKKKGDIILNEPVKVLDDIIDSVRYSIYSQNTNSGEAGDFYFSI